MQRHRDRDMRRSRYVLQGKIEDGGDDRTNNGGFGIRLAFLLLMALISGVSGNKLYGNFPSPTRGQKYCLVILPFVDCCVMRSD